MHYDTVEHFNYPVLIDGTNRWPGSRLTHARGTFEGDVPAHCKVYRQCNGRRAAARQKIIKISLYSYLLCVFEAKNKRMKFRAIETSSRATPTNLPQSKRKHPVSEKSRRGNSRPMRSSAWPSLAGRAPANSSEQSAESRVLHVIARRYFPTLWTSLRHLIGPAPNHVTRLLYKRPQRLRTFLACPTCELAGQRLWR